MLYGPPRVHTIRNYGRSSLNPYFVGKCSTAVAIKLDEFENEKSLNPYFVGKCSTAVAGNQVRPRI